MFKPLFRTSMVLAILLSLKLNGQIIYTFAGGGGEGYSGDNGPATTAVLNKPKGIGIDNNNNVYICDESRVRKLTTTANIYGFAGNSISNFGGDGGNAKLANLNYSRHTTTDSAGNIYIADKINCRIRKVTPQGVITTIAGTGNQGYNGDGMQANVTYFNHPCGMAFDKQGNLYVADSANNRVRKISKVGIVSTVAGSGLAGYSGDSFLAINADLNGPTGVVVDTSGKIYIADGNNFRIRKIVSGTITTIGGNGIFGFSGDGGMATAAKISCPGGITYHPQTKSIYFTDVNNDRVRKIDAFGIISTVAGNGSSGFSGDGGAATSAQLNKPQDLVMDVFNNIYVADMNNSRIRKVNGAGIISTCAGGGTIGLNGDGFAATGANLNAPTAIAVDANGNAYIADAGAHRIRKVSTSGVITNFAGTGVGGYSGDGGAAVNAQLWTPYGIAVDASGLVYFTDNYTHSIRKVDQNGIITTIAGNGTSGHSGDGGLAINAKISEPYGITFDAAGNLFFTEEWINMIRKINTSGIISTIAGTNTPGFAGDGGLAINALLNRPRDLYSSPSGNLFISDNNRIRKIDPTGTISTFAGNGAIGNSGDGGAALNAQFSGPAGMIEDATGNLYVSDFNNSVVRKVDQSGIINTFAGSIIGFSGDGGPPLNARMFSPKGLAMDANGNIYIVDYDNKRVREICFSSCLVNIASNAQVSNCKVLYPNPNNGSFQLEIQTGLKNPQLIICNSTGTAIEKLKLHCGNNTINLEAKKGFYTCMIVSENRRVAIYKFILE